MNKYLFLLGSLLFSCAAYAQIPGLEGKRISVHAEASVSLLFQDNYTEGNSNGFIFRPLIKPTFSLDYALNRKRSLAVVTRFYQMPYALSQTKMEDMKWKYGYNYADNPYFKANHIGIHYKMFKNSGLNPLGKYIYFGAELIAHKPIDGDRLFYSYDATSYELLYIDMPDETNLTFAPVFGAQNQFLIGKKLMAKVGVEFMWAFGGSGEGGAWLWRGGGYSIPPYDFYKKSGAASIRGANFMNANFGLIWSL